MRRLAWVLLVLGLAAGHAVAEGRWVKNGVTQEEMTQDHYACLKESQRQVKAPATYSLEKGYRMGELGIYAGPRTAGPTLVRDTSGINLDLYRACAAARGYVWLGS